MRYYDDGRYREYDNQYNRPLNLCYYENENNINNYWARNYYNGPMDFFPTFASMFQSYFIEPMDSDDFQALHEDLTKQDNCLGSLMAVGAEKGTLPVSAFYLLLASVLSLVIVLVGAYKKIRKGSAVPIPDDKTRSKMVPLWLGHIPLFILTIFFTVLFSTSLWPAWDHLASYYNENEAVDQALKLQKFHTFMGDCEFNNRFADGQKNLKDAITGALKNGNITCNADVGTRRYKELIQNDKDAIDEVLQNAEDLLVQLSELKSVAPDETDLEEIDYTVKTITKIVDELKRLQRTLKESADSSDVSMEDYKKQKEVYDEKITKLIEPLFAKIEDTASRFKVVKESLNTATKSFASWVKIVGSRFYSVNRELKNSEPLAVIIFLQVIVGLATILTLASLVIGFLFFGGGLAYPKGYYYCPGVLKFARRFLTLAFVLLGFFAIAVFFISGMALRFSASSTSICNTLTDFDYENRSRQGLAFYQHIKYDVVLKDFNGKSIKLNFGELLEDKSRSGLASMKGNLYEDLLPSISKIFDMEEFAKKAEEIILPKMDSVTIPDQTKILRPFKRSLLGLEDVDLTKLKFKKQMGNLINREIRTFKRLVYEMHFNSFNSFVIPGCSTNASNGMVKERNWQGRYQADNYYASSVTQKDRLRSVMRDNFEEYYEKMMSSLYNSFRFTTAYQSATSGFCIRTRLPASGVWLAATLLGTIILVNMIVIYKVSNRLCIHDEDVLTLENENFTSISTITAPLIDAKMTEKDVQVYDI